VTSSARPLRIGLNLLYLVEGAGGAGRYAEELMQALLALEPQTRLTAFVTASVQEELLTQEWSGGVEWHLYKVRPRSRRALLTQMLAVPYAASRRQLDLLHSPANVGVFKTVRAANVVTLLDLILLHPETSALTDRERFTTRLFLTSCARAADRVLTISEATKRDLIQTIGLDPSRIDVTPLGVRELDVGPGDERELRKRLALDDAPFVLAVAQKQRHKNLASLIRVLPELDGSVRLVLAGAPTPHERELRALTRQLSVDDRVRFVDWVSDAELQALYRAARAVVLPSFIEGFGLPVLEAMREGTPVACSERAALREVAGDAALLFDPADQRSITEAVSRLLGDEALRQRLVAAGLERAREFTWQRTAELTLAAYRRAIAARRGA
jgi:glycosyltransferase involved in cell wall biosynthesis